MDGEGRRRTRIIGTIALFALVAGAVGASRCGSTPNAPSVQRCDADLWAHVYTPSRLTVISACETMTGVVASTHQSEDGDVDMRVTPDPPFAGLLNAANEGTLQVEAICQGPITDDAPEVAAACRGFTGTVLIPQVGAHVRVTGSHVLDTKHKWMEIHPASVIVLTQ